MLLGPLPQATPEVQPPAAPSPAARLRLLRAPADTLASVEADLLLETVAAGADAILVCGDNRLDAYGLLAQARRLGLEDAVADGIVLARAFTVHQFVALLEETLPRMAEDRPVGLALVTGVLEPFHDEDVTDDEARILVPRTLRRLDALAVQRGFPVVATTHRATGRIVALAQTSVVDVVEARPPMLADRQRRLDAFGVV